LQERATVAQAPAPSCCPRTAPPSRLDTNSDPVLKYVNAVVLNEYRVCLGHDRYREAWQCYLPAAVERGTQLARAGAHAEWQRAGVTAGALYDDVARGRP